MGIPPSGPTVTFVIPSLRGGGAEFVVRTWATELALRGHSVSVLLTGHQEEEPELDARIRVVKLLKEGSGRWAEVRAVGRYLAGVDGAVIGMMTRTNLSLLVATLFFRRHRSQRLVISERNIPFREHDADLIHIAIRRFLVRYLYPRADALFAVSHAVGSLYYYAADLSLRSVHTIPNPSLAKSGVGSIEMRAGWNESTIPIVVPARLVEKKRPFLAIEVAELLRGQGYDAHVIFFGDGPLRDDLERYGGEVPIELRGFVDDWYDHVPGHSVVLLPSLVEGLPNVLIEAASRCIPSVVGATTFAVDAIVEGETGFIARVDSPGSYVEAVIRAAALEMRLPHGWLEQFTAARSTDVLVNSLTSLDRDTTRPAPL